MRGSAENLLDIVNDVLDFAKLEGDRVDVVETEFDLEALLQGVVDMMAPRAQSKGLFVASMVEPGLSAPLLGDPTLLRQVLVNLVGNGVKFTSAGYVIIDAFSAKGRGGLETLEIHVRDSGIGIPDAALPHLFEEFSQVDASISRRFGGTGLGLAISRRIMDRLGGTIDVDSWLDVGSTFKLSMPLVSQGQARPGAQAAPRPQMLAGRKILVVAENAGAREIYSRQFAGEGGEIRVASSGAAALELLREPSATRFDAALFDETFDTGASAAFAGELRMDLGLSGMRLLLATTVTRRLEQSAPHAALFDEVLTKPLPRKRLVLALGAPTFRTVQPSAALVAIGSASVRPAADRGIVLIVEDIATNRLVLGMLLQKIGYRFVSVGSGKEAVAAVNGQRYDAILMDLMMPEMDGLTATRIIRSLPAPACDTPIIALTASMLATDAASARAAGMDDLATKPITRNQLEAILDRSIEARKITRSATDAKSTSDPLEWQGLQEEMDFRKFGNLPEPALGLSPPSGSPSIAPAPQAAPQAAPNEALAALIREVEPDCIKAMIEVFMEDTDSRIVDMPLQVDQPQKISRQAHAIKSAAATFGLDDVTHRAASLERGATGMSPPALLASVNELKTAFDDAKLSLARLVS